MYKVFLAEDEIVVREGIRNSLPWEKIPFTLSGEAPDGEIALSMILDIKPDILITDIRMPFIDGLALARIVKKTHPWIKIIILSGHDEFEYAREAISIGVEEYLLKPVSAQEMLKALEKVAKRIGEEKEELLGLKSLKLPAQKFAGNEKTFDPADLLNIDDDIFHTKLKYAAKKDIDSIVKEYIAMVGESWGQNPMFIYFLFAEIIVSVSKIIEPLGGDIKTTVPFSLSHENIQGILSSPEAFYEKVKMLLASVFEFRDSHTEGRYQSVIVKARDYIDSNFASADISLYSTASHVGISPNHLSTVFAQETGENFIEYLTRVRIERAKLLLKNTAMKSADIAGETGFNDPHYFSYIFKKNTGFSPREFRNKEM
jgi:two-component system response regulator YesN